MAPPHPAGSVPHGSMHCHSAVPAAPLWKVRVLRLLGAIGTLRWSLATVKVWDTPVAGSSDETDFAGVFALGSAGSIGATESWPGIPVGVAKLSEPAGSAVASSKLTTVTVTSVFAGRTGFAGM